MTAPTLDLGRPMVFPGWFFYLFVPFTVTFVLFGITGATGATPPTGPHPLLVLAGLVSFGVTFLSFAGTIAWTFIRSASCRSVAADIDGIEVVWNSRSSSRIPAHKVKWREHRQFFGPRVLVLRTGASMFMVYTTETTMEQFRVFADHWTHTPADT